MRNRHPDRDGCPAGHHTPYASELLAENAAWLHTAELPFCPSFEWFPCGDHWHVGHPSSRAGKACKNDPRHIALRTRKAKVRRIWSRTDRVHRFRSRSSARRATIDSEASDDRRRPDPRRRT